MIYKDITRRNIWRGRIDKHFRAPRIFPIDPSLRSSFIFILKTGHPDYLRLPPTSKHSRSNNLYVCQDKVKLINALQPGGGANVLDKCLQDRCWILQTFDQLKRLLANDHIWWQQGASLGSAVSRHAMSTSLCCFSNTSSARYMQHPRQTYLLC